MLLSSTQDSYAGNWKFTNAFQTKYLRKIKWAFWTNTIRDDILLRETDMAPVVGSDWKGEVAVDSFDVGSTGKRWKGWLKDMWGYTAEKQP